MKVKLTATDGIRAWLKNNKSLIGFDHTEINRDSYNEFIEIELKSHADFYQLICNLSVENPLIVSSANESECDIEIYDGYRE
jgi:hypothetical protein